MEQTVLIVGATRGIGLQLASAYAAGGARRVHATGRERTDELRELAERHSGRVVLHNLDVRSVSGVARLAASLAGEALDLLIHVAGVSKGNTSLQLDVNARAPFAVVDALVPALLRSRAASGGGGGRAPMAAIITSDIGVPKKCLGKCSPGADPWRCTQHVPRGGAAALAMPESCGYVRSKLAANYVFRCVAAPDWRARGVQAVVMQPGWVTTDMTGMAVNDQMIRAKESAAAIRATLAALPEDSQKILLDYRGYAWSWETGKLEDCAVAAPVRHFDDNPATLRKLRIKSWATPTPGKYPPKWTSCPSAPPRGGGSVDGAAVVASPPNVSAPQASDPLGRGCPRVLRHLNHSLSAAVTRCGSRDDPRLCGFLVPLDGDS